MTHDQQAPANRVAMLQAIACELGVEPHLEVMLRAIVDLKTAQQAPAGPVTIEQAGFPASEDEPVKFYLHPLEKRWYPAICWGKDFDEKLIGTPWNPQAMAMFKRVDAPKEPK